MKKILFIVSSAEIGFWLAECTHPFWHLAERGYDIDIASPKGGRTIIDPASDPYSATSLEKGDLVSKGFMTDKTLMAKLQNTMALKDVKPEDYEGIHIVGGGGAAVDLYPNAELAKILESFWKREKIVGAICHGAIAIANNPDRVKGKRATGFSRKEDALVEEQYGKDFIPNFPQPVMEKAGIKFSSVEPWGVQAVIDGKLITGQNQMSASEYAIAYTHLLANKNPVITI